MSFSSWEKTSLVILAICFIIFTYALTQGKLMSIGYMLMVTIGIVVIIIRNKKRKDNY